MAVEKPLFNENYTNALQLDTGYGVDVDFPVAFELYLKAVSEGDANAAIRLAHLYETGESVDKSAEKALKYYRIAANRGHPRGHFDCGRLLYAEKRYSEALDSFSCAAGLGHLESIVMIGIAYERGHGVPKDESKAADLFRVAAIHGNTHGMIRLAACYRDGRGVPQSDSEMLKPLREARDRGDAEAWNEFGILYETGQIPSEDRERTALECYEKAAELGYVHAQTRCGEIYSMGLFGERDVDRGIRWLERAIESDDSRARYVMAVLRWNGIGIEKDSTEAFRLCQIAADAGEEDAEKLLASMLEREVGKRP